MKASPLVDVATRQNTMTGQTTMYITQNTLSMGGNMVAPSFPGNTLFSGDRKNLSEAVEDWRWRPRTAMLNTQLDIGFV